MEQTIKKPECFSVETLQAEQTKRAIQRQQRIQAGIQNGRALGHLQASEQLSKSDKSFISDGL